MNFIALVQIDFSSGTKYYSFQGDRSTSQWYEAKLLSMSRVSYSLDPLTGSLRIADIDIQISNVDLSLSILRAQDGFYNVPIRVLCGDRDAGGSQFVTVFEGKIYRWRFTNSIAELRAKDYKFGRFQEPVTQTLDVISDTDYPNLPENILRGELIPLVYGSLSSTVDLPVGQIACTLVDPAIGQTTFRYLVCQHPVSAITQAYRYGVAIAMPSVVEINGRTYLEFTEDQRATRSYFDRTYDQIVVDGAVSRWLFNEGTGTSVNDEDDANDGTLTSGASWHTSSYGKNFVDLNPGYIDCGRPANLELVGDMTIILWVDDYYLPFSISKRVLINNGEELDVRGWAWYWTAGHELEFRTNTSGANQITRSAVGFSFHSGESPSDGNFSFLALRKASGVVTMYVDGRELSEAYGGYDFQPTHTNPATPTGNFLIGDSDDAITMKSSIGHARIFNTALTDAQIKALAHIPFANFTRQDENEISADVDGILDDNSPQTLITNPVLQARDWILRAGVDPSEIDESLFSDAASRSDALGYVSSFAVLDLHSRFEDVLSQLASSFGLVIALTLQGKYGAFLFDSVEQADIDAATPFSDSNEILSKSFEQFGSDHPISSTRYNHTFQWVEQIFEARELYTDSAEVTALGQDVLHDSELDLWPIRGESPALLATQRKIALLKEDRLHIRMGLPIELFERTICEVLSITHREGADSLGLGFINKSFKTTDIELDLNPTNPRLSLRAIQVDVS